MTACTLLHKLNEGDMLLGYDFPASNYLLWKLQTMGVDCLCKQIGGRGRSTDFRNGKSLGSRDHLIDYSKPPVKTDWLSQSNYDVAPATLPVRELRLILRKGAKGEIWLPQCAAPRSIRRLISKPYTRNDGLWSSIFVTQKTTLGMDVLSCHTPEMVKKEIYNLIRILMAQSVLQASCLPNELSFKNSVQLWLALGRYGRVEIVFLVKVTSPDCASGCQQSWV